MKFSHILIFPSSCLTALWNCSKYNNILSLQQWPRTKCPLNCMVSEWSLLSCWQTVAFSCCMYFDVADNRAGSQSVIACWCCCRQGHRLHGYHCVFCTWLMARPISCQLSLKACSLTVCSLMVCCQTTVSTHSVLTSLLTRPCLMYVLLTYLLCSFLSHSCVSLSVTLLSCVKMAWRIEWFSAHCSSILQCFDLVWVTGRMSGLQRSALPQFLPRWALVSLDGVAPSWMVGVSASVNLPLHHKVQKFSAGTGSPGWS